MIAVEKSTHIKKDFIRLTGFAPTSPEDQYDSYIEYKDIVMLMDIDFKLLILPILVGFIFIYYLNKNHMMNNSQDIALLKLIGMTNQDIIMKQLYKALIITSIVIAFEVFWIVMLNLYYKLVFIPVLILCICIHTHYKKIIKTNCSTKLVERG